MLGKRSRGPTDEMGGELLYTGDIGGRSKAEYQKAHLKKENRIVEQYNQQKIISIKK